ncbi:unnamed protein product, partial [Meganyctiphanes norvegica]
MVWAGALASLGSGIAFAGLFLISEHLLTKRYLEKSLNLSHKHVLNICEAIVSGFQATLSSICGVIVVTSCCHDVMWAVHPLASWYAWIAAGYFTYDIWAMYKVYFSSLATVPTSTFELFKGFIKRRTLLIAHHVILITVLFPVLVYRSGLGDFFVGCFFCVELSGPFTNGRVILSRLGLKNSRLYLLNGIAMIVTFALCRILVFPYMYLAYGDQYNLDVMGVIRKIPLHCNLGCM